MEKSDGEKILPDLQLGVVQTKKMKKALADLPAELPIDDDGHSATNTETETDSDSDLDSEYECSVCKKKISGYIPFKQHQKGKKHAKAVLRKKREKKLLEKGEDDETVEDDDGYLIQEPYAVCKTCDKEFSGPEPYQMHLKSKAHKHKVLEVSVLDQVKEKGEINADKLRELYESKRTADEVFEDAEEKITSLRLKDGDEKTHDEFECKECEKRFSGLTPFTQHLMSKCHAKQIEKKKLLHKVIPQHSGEVSGKSKQSDVSTLSIEDDILVCRACSTSFSGPENAIMHLKSKKHSRNLDKYVRKLEKRRVKAESKKSGLGSDEKEEESQPEKENQDETKKESKESGLDSDEKEEESQPEKENQDETTKEEPQPTTDSPCEPEISENSVEETAKPSASGDKVDEGHLSYEKYKKYKDLMHSLRQEDAILQ